MSARTRLLVDVLLFGAFVASYYPLKTGLPLHEWLCLALLAPAGLHLVLNWDWLERVYSTFFGRLRRATRVNFTVDVLLLVATVSVMLSGFLVSRVVAHAIGYKPTTDLLWYRVHSLAANATIGLMVVHLTLHWKWVKRVVRTRILANPNRAAQSGARATRPGSIAAVAQDRPVRLSSTPKPIPAEPFRRVARSGPAQPDRFAGQRSLSGERRKNA
jgi:hypothetical protein